MPAIQSKNTTARSTPVLPRVKMTADDQAHLFQALDLLQKQSAETSTRTNSLLDARAREDEMVGRLADLQRAQGREVNEVALREAVRATREPTDLVYDRSPESAFRTLSNVYLARGRWLPPTLVSLVVACLIWGGVETTQFVRQRAFEDTVATNVQVLDTMRANRAAFDGISSRWPKGLGQSVHLRAFENALSQSDTALESAATVLATPARETIEQASDYLNRSKESLQVARSSQIEAQAQQELVERAKRLASAPDDATWPEVNARRRAKLSDLDRALAAGNTAEARQSIVAIGALENASAIRTTLREASGLVPAVGQGEAQALRTRGEAALLNADTSAAQASLTSIRALTDIIAAVYTMRVVNEEGVDSGFWRAPNDNTSVHNFYIVVDAVDTSGNSVSVPVINEENGKRETVSRFAVRVAESVYESVKADKMDNGLIDVALVGTKSAGKIKPDYNVDTAGGGIITAW